MKTPKTHAEMKLQEARKLMVRGFLYAGFLSTFVNLCMLIGPLFMIEVYHRVIPARSVDTLYGLMIIGALGVLIYGVLEFSRSFTYHVMAQGFAQKLNLHVVQAGTIQSLKDGKDAGVQALRDLIDLRYFISSNAINLPLDALWSLLFVGVLFLLHPVYGFVAIGIILLMVAINILTNLLTRQPLTDANRAQARHVEEVGSSLRHAEVIEAMGMLPALARSWKASHDVMLDLADTANIRGRALISLSKGIQKSLQMITVATGAFLVLAGEINAGVLFAAMILTSQAVAPYSSLIETWRQWISAMESWKRIKSILTTEAVSRQTMPVTAGRGDFIVNDLTYLPKGMDVPVLHGLSFRVSPGEILGVVGPSGAGKSTLARCMVGVVKPTSGGIYLDGNSTWLWERSSFGRAVGYLPQNISMLDGTIRQTISRMEVGDPAEVIKAARAADIHELIGRLPYGYETPIREGLHLLSGGQLQRLALARALYGEPQLIVLDEPNSNLDHIGEQALVRAVEAARSRGAIVIMIAHRPSVMACADKMLVLVNGQVSQFGPRSEVINLFAANSTRPHLSQQANSVLGKVHTLPSKGGSDGK
jgi:ATP-binding cassette, subfamily C, bacterial